MTRDAFKQLLRNEMTVGCSLPFSVNDAQLEQIINRALNWSWINYQYAVQDHFFIVERNYWESKQFKATRSLKLPDCIVSVYEVKEIRGYQKLSYFGADFSAEKMIAQEIYLSPFNSDDMVLRVAYESYFDLSKAFFLDRVAYDFNHNSKVLAILGRDPKHAVCIRAYTKIPEESLFDDWTFQEYVIAQCFIALGRILGTFSYSLPGGISINASEIKSEGESRLEAILTKIDEENVPDWMYIFH